MFTNSVKDPHKTKKFDIDPASEREISKKVIKVIKIRSRKTKTYLGESVTNVVVTCNQETNDKDKHRSSEGKNKGKVVSDKKS